LTVLGEIYDNLLVMLGPVLPLLVEEAWHYTPSLFKGTREHPLRRMIEPAIKEKVLEPSAAHPSGVPTFDNSVVDQMSLLLAANKAVKGALELARGEKKIGSSLQSNVIISFSPEDTAIFESFQKLQHELSNVFGVTSVSLLQGPPSLPKDLDWHFGAQVEFPSGQKAIVHIIPPENAKCIRCWKYTAPVEADPSEAVCPRCEEVLDELREMQPELFQRVGESVLEGSSHE
jgi:isoleucyl-tRNA synthetase